MSIREEAENERQKLKNMSWKDRAWYVWEYYKFHLLAVILVIGVLSTIGTMIYRQTFTTRLSVAIINDRSAGASSSALLESDLREYLGCGKKDLIEINEGLLPPELYERVKDHIYRAKDGEGNLTPVALSLEDTALGEKTGIIMDPPYLAVIQGSPHKEAALQMIEYLFP